MSVGGDCAILNFEFNMMVEYVAEMAIKLALPQSPISPSFRKSVFQILSSTGLSRATILLGMNYLSKRINGLKTIGAFHPIERQVWQMLIIALLLGSKFLDDNVLQNRSWSKASGISFAELNKFETEWLVGIGWNLYVNLDRSEDYNAWGENCSLWMSQKMMVQTLANRMRLTALVPPTDTDFAGRRNHAYTVWHQQQVAKYENLSSTKHTSRLQEIGWNQYSASPWLIAPLTPLDSSHWTSEYPSSVTSGNVQFHGEWLNRAFANDAQAQRYSQHLQPQTPVLVFWVVQLWPKYFKTTYAAECPFPKYTGAMGMKDQHTFLLNLPTD